MFLKWREKKPKIIKDNFHDKVWFKSLYKQVKSWYCLRYGESFSQSKPSTAIGVISLYGTPFEVSIPLFVRQNIEKIGESACSWKTCVSKIYDVDKYGRSVGVVFVGKTNVNLELIKAGYAWQYRKYCKASFCVLDDN
jgi:hypothetical protein